MRSILYRYRGSRFDWLTSPSTTTTPVTRGKPVTSSKIRFIYAVIIIWLQVVSQCVVVATTRTAREVATALPFIKYGLRHRRLLHTASLAFTTHTGPNTRSAVQPTRHTVASQSRFRSAVTSKCSSAINRGGPYHRDFHRRLRLRRSSRLTMAANHDNNKATGSNGVGSGDASSSTSSSVGKLQIYPLECYEDLIQEKQQRQKRQQGQETSRSDDDNSNNSSNWIRTIQRIHIIRHAEGTHNVNMEYKLPINRDAPLTSKGKQQCYELAKVTAKLFPIHQNPPSLIITSTMTRCIQTTLLSLPHLIPPSTGGTSSTSTTSSSTSTEVEVDDQGKQQQQQQQYSSASSNSNVSSSSGSSCRSTSRNKEVPTRIIAHEGIRETVNYECDVRRSIMELQSEFPMIDFSYALPDIVVFEEEIQSDENDIDNTIKKKSSTTTYHDPIWHGYRQRLGHDHDAHCESAELHVVAKRGREFFEWLVQQQHEREQNRDTDEDDDGNHDDDDDDVVIICTHSAFLRCILNWSQEGGVPKLMPQVLDTRSDEEKSRCPNMRPLFEYCYYPKKKATKKTEGEAADHDSSDESQKEKHVEFETIMRSDYDNCELRSFCLVQRG